MFRPSEELQNEWSERLKDSGFDDIDPGDSRMIQPVVLNTETESYLGGIGYYQFCQRILSKRVFKEDTNKEILRLKKAGFSILAIYNRISKGPNPFTRRHISRIVKGLDKDVDRTIFELHTEGTPAQEIEQWLLENEKVHLSKRHINRIIKSIQLEYGLNV
jgi:hypothetical protein